MLTTTRFIIACSWLSLTCCTSTSTVAEVSSTVDAMELASSTEPLDVVNRRMRAYNAHEYDAFLATYSESVEFYSFPRVLLGKGREHTRWVFDEMFEKAVMHVEVHDQMAIDNFVVNQETVDYGDKIVPYVSIYEVEDGLIQSVTFVRN